MASKEKKQRHLRGAAGTNRFQVVVRRVYALLHLALSVFRNARHLALHRYCHASRGGWMGMGWILASHNEDDMPSPNSHIPAGSAACGGVIHEAYGLGREKGLRAGHQAKQHVDASPHG